MKFLDSMSPTFEVVLQIEKLGVVPFIDTKTPFGNYYQEKLEPLFNKGIVQSYTNHPTEGYFYFLYDSNRFSREDAVDLIFKNVN